MFRPAIRAALVLAATATPALAAEFPLAPGQTAVGAVDSYTANSSEVLLDVVRHYDLGYVDFMAANPGVDPWAPRDGQKIVIPNFFILPDAPHVGIVINLAERRIYYYPRGGKTVETYPAGLATMERSTPLGVTRVVAKELGPVWVPPPSIRRERPNLPAFIGPGPDDPLGDFALRLGWKNYLIHGTNKPDSVGRNVSHGCLHIYPEDIERLFREVPVGTPVRTVDQPAGATWGDDGRLYIVVHPSKAQADEIDFNQPMTPTVSPALAAIVTKAAGKRAAEIDWEAVNRAGLAATGLPTPVMDAPAPPELQAATPD